MMVRTKGKHCRFWLLKFIIEAAHDENSTIGREVPIEEDAYTTLTNDLEKLLAEAQPRLTRLALAYGVSSDGVEDVVQETLVSAWQNLAHLRAPDQIGRAHV